MFAPKSSSSFFELSAEEQERRLSIDRYGDFQLTDAVRPASGIVPSEGYRHEILRRKPPGPEIPLLRIAASREKLMDLFRDLLDPLGEELMVVLQTSHESLLDGTSKPREIYRLLPVDRAIFDSTLLDHEDLLLDDGCTGIAAVDSQVTSEVEWDEHKTLIVYGRALQPFKEILARHRIACRNDMRFIVDDLHVHCSDEGAEDRFTQLQYALNMETEGEADEDPFAGAY